MHPAGSFCSLPGALSAPVAATDTFPSHLSVTMVTIVFCMVEGGKQYAAKSRRDAREVHVQLVALLRSVLLQVRSETGSRGKLV